MAIDLSMFFTTDEEGNEVELPRPETKSWSDVIQCVNHWQGQPKGDPVIDRFIEMYLLGLQWDWYEMSYKPWLEACEKVQAWNAAREPDDEGKLPEPLPEPAIPARPEADTVEQVRLSEANALRLAEYNDYQKQFAMLYDSMEGWKAWQDQVKAHYSKALG